MLGKRDHSGANRATALLATCFVVIGGAVACAFIVVTTSDDPTGPLTVVGLSFAAVSLLLWLLRDKPPRNPNEEAWGWLARQKRRVEYRVKPRVNRQAQPAAPNAPITAESVRAITGGEPRWVPSRGTRSRPPREPESGD